jgi:hypothetical protein
MSDTARGDPPRRQPALSGEDHRPLRASAGMTRTGSWYATSIDGRTIPSRASAVLWSFPHIHYPPNCNGAEGAQTKALPWRHAPPDVRLRCGARRPRDIVSSHHRPPRSAVSRATSLSQTLAQNGTRSPSQWTSRVLSGDRECLVTSQATLVPSFAQTGPRRPWRGGRPRALTPPLSRVRERGFVRLSAETSWGEGPVAHPCVPTQEPGRGTTKSLNAHSQWQASRKRSRDQDVRFSRRRDPRRAHATTAIVIGPGKRLRS